MKATPAVFLPGVPPAAAHVKSHGQGALGSSKKYMEESADSDDARNTRHSSLKV